MQEPCQPSLVSPLVLATSLQSNCSYSEFAEQAVSGQTEFKSVQINLILVYLVLTNHMTPNMTPLWKSQALSPCAPSLLAKAQGMLEKPPKTMADRMSERSVG